MRSNECHLADKLLHSRRLATEGIHLGVLPNRPGIQERNEFLFLVMPDTGGRRKRGGEWKLSNAHEIGQLVLVRCGLCNVKRWYQPRAC